MTNEEIQRVMEFIIKQQETTSENMAKAEERIGHLERAAIHLFNATTELNKSQKVLSDRMAELAEAQAHTDRRVNALIDIIMRERNGDAKDQT